MSDTPITDAARQRPEAMVEDGEVIWAVSADVAERLERDLDRKERQIEGMRNRIVKSGDCPDDEDCHVENCEATIADCRECWNKWLETIK